MALKRLGLKIEVVGYSEIDKYAIQVYEALHGKHKNYGGIGSFDRFPKDIDICTWSFPCQDISLAGKQRGMNDKTRSNYGYVFLDTVEATPYNERPKVLLMENVRALFSQTFAEDWREIQIRLEKLGYTSYSDILNAKDYGIAQNRERVFIVSILGEYYYEFPKPYKLEKRLKDYLEDEVDEKYYLSDKQLEMFKKNNTGKFNRAERFNQSQHKKPYESIAFTVTTRSGERPTDNFIVGNVNPSGRGINGNVHGGDLAPTLTTNKGEGIKVIVKTNNNENLVYKTKEEDMPRHRIYDTKSVGFTITTNENQQPMIIDKKEIYFGEYRRDEGIRTFKDGVIGTIRTIDAGGDKVVIIPEATKQGYALAGDGDGVYINRPHQKRGVVQKGMIQTIKTGQDVGVVDNLRIRKLTPREALRLMDVSEHDIDIILSEVSNTQAYKLAGNSIVVNVLVEIFRKLF